MRRKIFLIILIFLSLDFVLSQTIYLSVKKNVKNLMIGVEIFDQKNKFSIKPVGYNYEWTVPDISLVPQKTTSNVFSLSLPSIKKSFLIDVNIKKPLTDELYFFRNQKIFLSDPQVKIVRKTSEGFLLPISKNLKRGDSLTVITKDFASKNLTYVWEFNGVFISNEKEIPVSELKEKNGTIKIRVFGVDFRERGEDFKSIQIE
jgi:hypothetical protein